MGVIITSFVIAIVLFMCVVKAYLLGLQHGRELVQNQYPKFMRNPVTVYREYKQEQKQTEEEDKQRKQELEFEQGLINILNYTGEEDLHKEGDK